MGTGASTDAPAEDETPKEHPPAKKQERGGFRGKAKNFGKKAVGAVVGSRGGASDGDSAGTGAFSAFGNLTGVAAKMRDEAATLLQNEKAKVDELMKKAAGSNGLVHFVPDHVMPPQPPPAQPAEEANGPELVDQNAVAAYEAEQERLRLEALARMDEERRRREEQKRREEERRREEEARRKNARYNMNTLIDVERSERVCVKEAEGSAWGAVQKLKTIAACLPRNERLDVEKQIWEWAEGVARKQLVAQQERYHDVLETERVVDKMEVEKRKQQHADAEKRKEEERARLKREEERRAAERKRREEEEKRRREEAAKIAAANSDAEKERLRVEAIRRQEEEKRRREEALMAQLAAQGDSDEDDIETEPEPQMAGHVHYLFKICRLCAKVTQKGPVEKWAMWNGTKNKEVHVTFELTKGSSVKTLGTAVSEKKGDKTVITDVIYPGETSMFLEGKVNGWSFKCNKQPLSAEFLSKIAQGRRGKIDAEMNRVAGLNISDPEKRLAACAAGKIPFVDLDFPPTEAAFLGISAGSCKRADPGPWARPPWYLPKGLKPRLVKNGIDPNDIQQGALGDCWFVASTAAVADHRKEKILAMLEHPSENVASRKGISRCERRVGGYRVTFSKGGWYGTHIVDDYLPAVFEPRFGKGLEPNELWVSLVEKAYAKVHRGYASITGGQPAMAMRDITGSATWTWGKTCTMDPREKFDMLSKYCQAGYLMVVSTGADTDLKAAGLSVEDVKAMSLFVNHAYSLLDLKIVNGLLLCRIRNPHGQSRCGEWTGKWSDNCDMWRKHPDVARAVGFTAELDGAFWMEWHDVQKYFMYGAVCFARHNWFDRRVQCLLKDGVPNLVLVVYVKAPVNVDVGFWQPCGRAEMGSFSPSHAISLRRAESTGDTNYTYVQFSTCDPERPDVKNRFDHVPCAAMNLRLAPSDKPYLFVPKVHAPATFDGVLSLISDKPAGSAFTVAFRRIPDGHEALNQMTFPVKENDLVRGWPMINAPVQIKNEGACPVTKTACGFG